MFGGGGTPMSKQGALDEGAQDQGHQKVRMTAKGAFGFKGVSRHDRNCHYRRNCQTRQNRNGCLVVLYFRGKQKEGKVLSRNAKTVKTAKTVMKATLLRLNPPFRHPEKVSQRTYATKILPNFL